MYCTRNVTEDLIWVGGNNRRLSLFEGVYKVPYGVSYNSYLLLDEKTVLFDTADSSIAGIFFENVEHALNGRTLDYMVIQHMEPDHCALIHDVVRRYPEVTIVTNAKVVAMIKQFFDFDIDSRVKLVAEGDEFVTGKHCFTFIMAPMVHWPEVMVTYDKTDKILFSADAFGCFGALNGALFADEVDFYRDYLDEARRYYTNIVGKYGAQVQALLKKASALEISMICPLHGFVWRKDFEKYIEKYDKWSKYEPEKTGVVIAYGSIYGNTENAAEILACRLNELGIATKMFDVSVVPASEIVSAAFEYSHIVLASATYNGGIFVNMENLIHDLVAHNLQNRTVALVENGTWAAMTAKQTKELLAKCKNLNVLEETVSIKSSVKPEQLDSIEALANAIKASM
ncbi:MAG: FprA family A-type flavoprotein [Bacteroides sp.]|nr:FprA family A-type flavoprotein [Clostridia bacterium]